MRSYEEITKECEELIPRDVISTREGGNGRQLDYLTGHYVISRLNKVLGPGNWAYTAEASLLHQGTISSRSGDVNSVHYSAKVRLVVTLGDKPTEFTDYGYGDGTDRSNPGKAHELAIKEAVTDGLKRCAKNLGNSFGLGLYDKSGDGIDEGDKGKSSAPSSSQSPVKPKQEEHFAPVLAQNPREITNKLIAQYAKVAIDKKAMTLEEVKELVKTFGASSKEELIDAKAQEFLAALKERVK